MEEWTHHCHLRVALAVLRDCSPERALAELRESIQRLNLRHGVWTTPERGYHETLTRVWLCLVLQAMHQLGETASASEILQASGHSQTPLSYYTRETLFSWQARIAWVPPDLRPLPIDPGPWAMQTPPLFSIPVGL